ncbi:MAG: dihydrolipoamide acetyltransferase family protein [Chlamydia sp.]
MPFTLTMPKLSPTMTEGVIAKWHKKLGDFIEAGDLILEVSTDKATIEHNALDPGWMRKILVQDGEKAEVNQVLAILSEEENESIDLSFMEEKKSPEKANLKEKKEEKHIEIGVKSSHRTIASPLAKKIAQERGINLQDIAGSGPRGRVMSRDLESAEQSHCKKEAASKSTCSEKLIEGRSETLSSMRQVIAKRLQESKSTIPHFYATIDVQGNRLVAIREEMKKAGLSITINDFIVKATALALMEHPVLLTHFNPKTDSVTYFPNADIAIAVSIDGGLITPIVAKAEEKSIAVISQEIKKLADKAKKNRLLPHEFMGGAFTISNLGMFGIESFQAIINPPQTAILAVGGMLDRPVIENGVVVPGKVMSLTLSCDHRVIDGADGAKFLQTLQLLLQNPLTILGR